MTGERYQQDLISRLYAKGRPTNFGGMSNVETAVLCVCWIATPHGAYETIIFDDVTGYDLTACFNKLRGVVEVQARLLRGVPACGMLLTMHGHGLHIDTPRCTARVAPIHRDSLALSVPLQYIVCLGLVAWTFQLGALLCYAVSQAASYTNTGRQESR